MSNDRYRLTAQHLTFIDALAKLTQRTMTPVHDGASAGQIVNQVMAEGLMLALKVARTMADELYGAGYIKRNAYRYAVTGGAYWCLTDKGWEIAERGKDEVAQ